MPTSDVILTTDIEKTRQTRLWLLARNRASKLSPENRQARGIRLR